MAEHDEMAEDLLKGARAIGGYIGENERIAFYLCETHQIPAFKRGKLWMMRKSVYRSDIENSERESSRPKPSTTERAALRAPKPSQQVVEEERQPQLRERLTK